MRQAKIIVHYQSSDSHHLSKAPAEAGRAEDVVRCVANLDHKGIVGNISFDSSHVLYKKGKGYTYEVKFMGLGKTKRKRFTVYKLSGINAKSECYQVTDPEGKYIVVKIPPQPITEINAYLDAVVHERILAKKLLELGIKVVVPCVSSVMKHLHKFDFAQSMSSCETEDAYMEILRIPKNKFIKHFKIGSSFVFFMEFLDEPFLGKVVREFYNKELLVKIKKDIVERDFNLIHKDDRLAFLSDYKNIGTKQSLNEIYSGLRETYESFCSRFDSLLKEFSLSLDQSKKRDFFIANILGELIDESSFLEINNFDEKFLSSRLNSLINATIWNSASFKRYSEILDREVNWLAFKYSSRKMKMIGNNLLALLVKLEEMGLVLRDLKVDNLFISDLENMELGVIDLETGGDIGSESIEGIVPAGMPSNMTVSNLLFVNQLKKIYGESNVGEILHIQDWYATIAMMFEANIGSTLFDDARDYILNLNMEIDARVANNYCDFVRNNPGIEVTSEMIEEFFYLSDEEIKGHSWQFLALARRDLKKKCLEYRIKLKEIKYCLPDTLKRKISDKIEIKLKRIQDDYRNYKLSDTSIEYLNKSTIDVLKQNLALKERLYITKKANFSLKDKKRLKLAVEIEIYKNCIRLKQKEKSLNKKIYLLNQEQISAFDLFPIMLDFVIEVMCRDEWHKYRPRVIGSFIGREGKNKQRIDAADGWKSTIIPTKEELAQWARKSREFGLKTRGFGPPVMVSFDARRNDDEKTLKKSI